MNFRAYFTSTNLQLVESPSLLLSQSPIVLELCSSTVWRRMGYHMVRTGCSLNAPLVETHDVTVGHRVFQSQAPFLLFSYPDEFSRSQLAPYSRASRVGYRGFQRCDQLFTSRLSSIARIRLSPACSTATDHGRSSVRELLASLNRVFRREVEEARHLFPPVVGLVTRKRGKYFQPSCKKKKRTPRLDPRGCCTLILDASRGTGRRTGELLPTLLLQREHVVPSHLHLLCGTLNRNNMTLELFDLD